MEIYLKKKGELCKQKSKENSNHLKKKRTRFDLSLESVEHSKEKKRTFFFCQVKLPETLLLKNHFFY